MFLNDREGDCTVAAAAHAEQVAFAYGEMLPCGITDDDVQAMYDVVSGGVDQGADPLTVFAYSQKRGSAARKPGPMSPVRPASPTTSRPSSTSSASSIWPSISPPA